MSFRITLNAKKHMAMHSKTELAKSFEVKATSLDPVLEKRPQKMVCSARREKTMCRRSTKAEMSIDAIT